MKESMRLVPEISHGEVEMCDVRVPAASVLEGDGYELYMKPFRTVEDIHVLGAALGYCLAAARDAGWPERCVAYLFASDRLFCFFRNVTSEHIGALCMRTTTLPTRSGCMPACWSVGTYWQGRPWDEQQYAPSKCRLTSVTLFGTAV